MVMLPFSTRQTSHNQFYPIITEMRITRTLALTTLLFLLPIIAIQAQERIGNIEVGIMLGEPTGFSAKFWETRATAFDAGLAWSFGTDEAVHAHGDYLLHLFMEESAELAFFYGIGARTLISNTFNFGIRLPIGLQYLVPESRLTLFFELAPVFNLVPNTRIDVNGGIGVRYFL
ncbi:MAG: hypothetical protein WD529_05025 [Balneolaceae bacterium]